MNAPEYKIQKLTDFANIPEDRLDACFEEFKGCLEHIREIRNVTNALQSLSLIDPSVAEDALALFEFTLVDDGKRDATINIHTIINDEDTASQGDRN